MIRQRLGKDLLFFDGGMGTLLQEKGLAPGELPETWNLTHSEEIYKIHRQYIEAGSDIILTNTFGANALKFHDDSCSLEEIIKAYGNKFDMLNLQWIYRSQSGRRSYKQETSVKSIRLLMSDLRGNC